MNTDNVAIRVTNLSKCYQIYATPRDRLKQFVVPTLCRVFPPLRKFFASINYQPSTALPRFYKEFWAIKDLSFEIKKGEIVGIIGRNGSGKSTLLQMICGTLNPTSGSIQTNGRIAALLELGSGFNPEFTGRENVYMNAAVLGLSQEEIDDRFDEIVAFADIGEFIAQPVKTYSSGMMVRLAFAVAIHVDPEVLIVDEALSVGDAYFQAKCAKMINKLMESGATVLFVSHDTASVKSLCGRALLLDAGRDKFMGDVNTAVEKYYSSLVKSQAIENAHTPITSGIKHGVDEFIVSDPKFLEMASFQRIQNGLAEFVQVAILDENGQPIESIVFGQTVTLRQVIKINSAVDKLGLAYHIRDKNGFDIVYSDTGIEAESHILMAVAGSVYLVEWTFTVSLRVGNYVVSSMASIPVNLRLGDVDVADFIPISAKFSVGQGENLPIYGAVHWQNKLHIREIK